MKRKSIYDKQSVKNISESDLILRSEVHIAG